MLLMVVVKESWVAVFHHIRVVVLLLEKVMVLVAVLVLLLAFVVVPVGRLRM